MEMIREGEAPAEPMGIACNRTESNAAIAPSVVSDRF